MIFLKMSWQNKRDYSCFSFFLAFHVPHKKNNNNNLCPQLRSSVPLCVFYVENKN